MFLIALETKLLVVYNKVIMIKNYVLSEFKTKTTTFSCIRINNYYFSDKGSHLNFSSDLQAEQTIDVKGVEQHAL